MGCGAVVGHCRIASPAQVEHDAQEATLLCGVLATNLADKVQHGQLKEMSPMELTCSCMLSTYFIARSWSQWMSMRKAWRLVERSPSTARMFSTSSGASGITSLPKVLTMAYTHITVFRRT